MSGLAAVQARISSIQDRMSELGLSQASGGAVMGGATSVTAAGGAQFAGMLGSLTQPDAAGGTPTAGLFGYVPAGTKLATIPGTQAHAQAEAAAALAAQQEAARRSATVAPVSAAPVAAPASEAGSAGGGAGAASAVAVSAVAAARATSGGAAGGSGGSARSGGSAGSGGTVGGAAPSVPVAAPAPKSGGLTGRQVVDTAKKYLGVPYVWGGQSRSGMDCSGLVQRTFLDHGIKLPRTARALMKAGTEVPSLAQAQPGDLIITRGGGHVSIYLGDNKIIHAPYKGEVVKIQKNYSTDATIDTIRRIV